MEQVIVSKLNFYREITEGKNKWVHEELRNRNIEILPGFINNQSLVREFYKEFYRKQNPRVVLCGINPGRLGAGKTGLPFLDFSSLSRFLPTIDQIDQEQSAQFIYKVISRVGEQDSFNHVYLTNVSWYGFVKKEKGQSKNVNYFELPKEIQNIIFDNFIEELEIINPKSLVPLSEKVEKTLLYLQNQRQLKYEIKNRLPHPYYCSFNKTEENIENYKNIIMDS